MHKAVSALLSDRRFGRFFLAAMDNGSSLRRSAVTIHASDETLSVEQERALGIAVREADIHVRVRVKRYSLERLATPKSIEKFYEPFRHDAILSDPTGAFLRAKELLTLTADLRRQFGKTIEKIFWRAETGELLLVVDAATASSDEDRSAEILLNAEAILSGRTDQSIRRYVKKIDVVRRQPSGRLTPVDELSVTDTSAFAEKLSVAGKIASAAALLGIGGMMPAQARSLPNEEPYIVMPGISALPGLTNLGEDAFGTTVLPRAFGGLRIYFGNSEPVLLAKCGLLFGFTSCPPKPAIEHNGNKGERRARYSS